MTMADEALELVHELTGSETGRWEVSTQYSSYLFDFDAGTVLRVPGPSAVEGLSDRPRLIRTIEVCRVGDRGYWTVHTDGWSETVDFWWMYSSIVRKIARLPTD
jgi:hypothetical protein